MKIYKSILEQTTRQYTTPYSLGSRKALRRNNAAREGRRYASRLSEDSEMVGRTDDVPMWICLR